MGFLAKIFAFIGPTFFNWLKDLIVELVLKWKQKKDDEEKNRLARESLEKAKTKEELDRAAEKISDSF